MLTKWTQQYNTHVTQHADAEAPTYHCEYKAQQWRTHDFRMEVGANSGGFKEAVKAAVPPIGSYFFQKAAFSV